MSKQLRTYQQSAIDAVKSELEKGKNRQMLVKAVGTGKTFTAVKLVEQLGFNRVLWITHTEELVEQSALAFLKDKFDDNFAKAVEEIGYINWVRNGSGLFAHNSNNFRMGIIKAQDFYIDGHVTMASAQTLHRRLDKFPVDYFDCIIVDEAHYFMSRTFNLPLETLKPKLLLGLTATPDRLDGISLGDTFRQITYSYDIADGIRDGNLCELDAVRIKTDLSLDNVRTKGGEFNLQDLSQEVDIPERNKLIVDSYLQYADGRQGIFFCIDIPHAIHVAEEFQSRGIKCEAVSSDEERTGDRAGKIKAYKNGEIQILTNVNILIAGFDAPNTGVIGHCSPTKSKANWIQRTGRGTRLKDSAFVEKFGQNCIILDYVDSTTRHKLVNAWTLDSGKPTEEKVFITKQKKLNLIEERERKKAFVMKTSNKDVKVDLFEIPQVKLEFKSDRWQEPATEKQLAWIARLGYDTVNVQYTKQQCSEIISIQNASTAQIALLRHKGYDVSNGVTIAEFQKAMQEVEKREQQELISRFTPNNDGKPFF